MRDFEDRVAVVTGAASGIGRALARRCAAERMKVVLADVDEAGLEETRAALAGDGAQAVSVPTDVSDSGQVESLADAAVAAFGGVHLVFNNAGVLVTGRAWERSEADWRWVLDVNLWGVIHGVRTFVPRLLAQGDPAHVVNTASVGGLAVGPYLAPYVVSKHAVVALTETVYYELEAMDAPVRVSVLCPGAVATGITASGRVRPRELPDAAPLASDAEKAFQEGLRLGIQAGIDPESLAEKAFEGIRADRLWILPDPVYRHGLERRFRSLMDETNPAL